MQDGGGGGSALGANHERLAGEAAVEDRLLRGPDETALRLPHSRGGLAQCRGAAQSKTGRLSLSKYRVTIHLGANLLLTLI